MVGRVGVGMGEGRLTRPCMRVPRLRVRTRLWVQQVRLMRGSRVGRADLRGRRLNRGEERLSRGGGTRLGRLRGGRGHRSDG